MVTNTQTKTRLSSYAEFTLDLASGEQTRVYVAKYPRSITKASLSLLDWCESNGVQHAMSGGFFLRKDHLPMGEMWLKGIKQDTVPFLEPWSHLRGSLCIDENGSIALAPRDKIPNILISDLVQAGPLLVRGGRSMIRFGVDTEGFSAGAVQFDDDISKGRFPRGAIGLNDGFIFSIACDGYRSGAGLTFAEFADFLVGIGVTDALNLDGGSSATIISEGRLRNKPRGGERDEYKFFLRGRPVFSAIVFEPVA